MRELLLAAAASALLNAGIPRPIAPPADARLPVLSPDTAVETASLLGLGMRRLSADLALIRLLIYYGTPETGAESLPEHFDAENGGGRYAELGPRALRILDLDPSFSYAALYSAGALAFNLGRPKEGLEVLRYALSRDPANLQLRVYVAAIGFARHGDSASVIRVLEPALSSPDCPTMIKSMVAFLYARRGDRASAARLYREIIETSRDPGYRSIAARMLAGLGG